MKKKNLDNMNLREVAFGDSFISPEQFIERNPYIFTSARSTCSYRFICDGENYGVLVRNYRKRHWDLLFYSRSARGVLQDLYDFIYG